MRLGDLNETELLIGCRPRKNGSLRPAMVAQSSCIPWGDRWEPNRAVVREATPRAVGTYPEGKNRWGVVDLVGNVWEWTSSKASVYLNKVEIPEGNRDWVVARGGSYASDPEDRAGADLSDLS